MTVRQLCSDRGGLPRTEHVRTLKLPPTAGKVLAVYFKSDQAVTVTSPPGYVLYDGESSPEGTAMLWYKTAGHAESTTLAFTTSKAVAPQIEVYEADPVKAPE